jgi:predicted NUDIX family NTP pyrophosphohydrolase
LEPLRQPSGKLVYAWAVKHDFEPTGLKSNTFSLEWPPKSGQYQEFPEIDRAEWFSIEKAQYKILKGQASFLDQLLRKLKAP